MEVQSVSQKKNTVINILWACASVLINYGINFLLTPYVTNNIGIEAYGFVALSNTFISYIDIISIAINAFAIKYIAMAYHKNNMREVNEYFSSVIIANLGLSIIVLIPASYIIMELEELLDISNILVWDVKLLFALVIVKYILTMLRTAFNASTFIVNRLGLAEKHKTISYVINAIILCGLFLSFEAQVWFVGVAGIGSAVYLLFVNWLMTNRFTPELKFKTGSYSLKRVHVLLKSGVWNAINNLGNILNSGFDLIIANIFLSGIIMGQVSIAKSLSTICYSLISTISNTLRPKQTQQYANGKINELVLSLKSSMEITGLAGNVIISGFIACGQVFLNMWIPNEDIKLIFVLSVIVLMSDIMTGVVNPLYYVFTLTNNVKFPCYVTIGMGLANVFSMYLLLTLTEWGAYAIVLTTLVINFIHFIDVPLYAAFCLKVPFRTFYPVIYKHLFATGINIILMKTMVSFLPPIESWLNLILISGLLGILGLCVGSLILIGPKKLIHLFLPQKI